ncbi:Uncharacterised protein [Klebsiella pneumoniae]|nr:Uncharacterised protein [Klebsiella pneumoniae]
MDNHRHDIIRFVNQANPVKFKIPDIRAHHDGIHHRVIVYHAGFTHRLTMDNHRLFRQPFTTINRTGNVQIWNICKHKFIKNDNATVCRFLGF